MSKNVIVTGVTGQDGSLMVDYLLKNTDYKIYGTARRLSVKNHDNILHLEGEEDFSLINMDLNDAHSIRDIIIKYKPDYFINFAAQSFVAGSWEYPIQTWVTDSDAVLHILESIRRFAPQCRFYNAGSSEEFGDVVYSPQNENHPLRPQSPYGAAKCAARHIVRVYRESYGLYAIQGWLFNHEGPRRGLDFVTRKITNTIGQIKSARDSNDLPLDKKYPIPVLSLGNLEAKRDWSDAEDFMEGVWLMLNQNDCAEYVLASGETHTIREFLEACLDVAQIEWVKTGAGANEKYFEKESGELIVDINPKFYRPAEVHSLCGDPSLAEENLNWKRKGDFLGLVRKMFLSDCRSISPYSYECIKEIERKGEA
jgi:GDPmannose 4,6-dehydratase